jgi:hypothetical protein
MLYEGCVGEKTPFASLKDPKVLASALGLALIIFFKWISFLAFLICLSFWTFLQ